MSVCISSGNGLVPNRRKDTTWNNVDLLFIGSLGTNFGENLIEILAFSRKKMCLTISSAKLRPFCPGGDELICVRSLGFVAKQISKTNDILMKYSTHISYWCHIQYFCTAWMESAWKIQTQAVHVWQILIEALNPLHPAYLLCCVNNVER